MKRTLFLVATSGGAYLGYRRGGWNGDRHDFTKASLNNARIYTRRQDASAAADRYAGIVVEGVLLV